MNTSASNRRLRVLLADLDNGNLILQADNQGRPAWTNKDKVEFIRTVLDGYPFPEVYIAAGKVDTETGEGVEILVDGGQRLTTLYQYFKGLSDLLISDRIPKYSDLGEAAQIEFLEYMVVVRDMGNMSVDEIREFFKRIGLHYSATKA